MTLTDTLRRGLAAGAVAGLLAGLFALLVGEVPLRAAIAIEQATAAVPAGDPAADPPLVDRTTQQAVLPVATAVVGATFGGIFGLALLGLRRRLRAATAWQASLRLGAVAWCAVALVPALANPADPPGVGDPAAIGARSAWFVGTVALGVLVALALWLLALRLRELGVDEVTRQLAVGGLALAAVGAAVALVPGGSTGGALPADLVWSFRLASMTTQLLLWLGIATGLGWLQHRAELRESVALSRGVPS